MGRVQFPDKLEFLFHPARYKVAYGGRGGPGGNFNVIYKELQGQ